MLYTDLLMYTMLCISIYIYALLILKKHACVVIIYILYYMYILYAGNIQNLAGPRGTFLARLFIATETITLNMRTIFTAPESIVSYRRFIYNAIYDFIMYIIVCYKECIRTCIVCIHYINSYIVGPRSEASVTYITYSSIAHTYDKWKGMQHTHVHITTLAFLCIRILYIC